MSITESVAMVIGLTVGNFVYQACKSQDWATAIERSYFQAVAILMCYIASLKHG